MCPVAGVFLVFLVFVLLVADVGVMSIMYPMAVLGSQGGLLVSSLVNMGA